MHSILDPGSPVKAAAEKRAVKRTDTPQFKHWFKGSQAIDENGEPLVLYHGSKATDIEEFRTKNKKGLGGLHLSKHEDVSQAYAGADGKVNKLYASIKQPYVVDANKGRYDSIAPTAELMEYRRATGEPESNINLTADASEYAAYAREAKNEDGQPRYDGLIIKNVHEQTGHISDDYIVFEPTQVKDAEENIGLFDEYNPKRKYSLPSRNALEAQILAWQKAHQSEIDAAKKNGDSRSQQPDTLQRNPLPDPVKRVIDDNAIFRSYKADTNEEQFNRAMEKLEENGYAKEVKRLLDADDFSLDDSVEAGALAIAAFARVIRLWGIERQKCSNELTKTMSRSIIIHHGTLCPVRPLPAGFSAPSGAGI